MFYSDIERVKKSLLLFIFSVSTLLFSSQSFAGVWGELNGFYNSDSFLADEDATFTQTYYNLDVFANLDNNYTFYAGFHVHQLATTSDVTGATDNSFSTLDMGPMLMYVIDQKRIFTMTANFNVIAKATNDGSQTANWSGTSMLLSLGVTPEIKDGWYAGFRLNYYSASYSDQTVGSAASTVSHSRTMIFPTFVLSYRK